MLGKRRTSTRVHRRAHRVSGFESLEQRLALSAAPPDVDDLPAEVIAIDGLVAARLLASASPVSAPAEQQMAPDFQLLNVNPTSSTYGEIVSPRDYFGEVSAWYFGHST
jgi:hypothetical protein